MFSISSGILKMKFIFTARTRQSMAWNTIAEYNL
jgi:hypothetical protein